MDNYRTCLRESLSSKSMRSQLVHSMTQAQYDTSHQPIYPVLSNMNHDTSTLSTRELKQIVDVLHVFERDGRVGLLRDIANRACLVPTRVLIDEIMQNDSRITTHGTPASNSKGWSPGRSRPHAKRKAEEYNNNEE
eukprot:727504_1